jgi:hypothetical protein
VAIVLQWGATAVCRIGNSNTEDSSGKIPARPPREDNASNSPTLES